MSVRKREWTSNKGGPKEAWIVDYVDQRGRRHIKTFSRKKEADAYHSTVGVAVRNGTHTPDSGSISVAEAGKLWLATGRANNLERSTLDSYEQHLDLHIAPYIGSVRLSSLSAPLVREFEDKLRLGTPAPGQATASARSQAMTKRIIGDLGSILADAQERGLVARNVVRELRSRRRRGNERRADRRQRGKLKIGVDIPAPAEIKAIVASLTGRWRPVILTAIFTGLRASELRGLRWRDVELDRNRLHVRQRADRFGAIGKPKSESGERTVPLTPLVTNTLKEWKLRCPKGELGLVFPNGLGHIESHANIVNRGFLPAQVVAGVDVEGIDAEGSSIRRPKYTGLHSLRHFYASWAINRRADGGLELPPKIVQERLGHSSIMITMDRYGHLFPREDDGAELADAERRLLA